LPLAASSVVADDGIKEATMNLTSDQQQALGKGEPVPITVAAIECVVIRKDIYERVQHLCGYDTNEFDPDDALPLVNDVMKESDEHDPLLDSYQRFKP
jgi:hypothetical protein